MVPPFTKQLHSVFLPAMQACNVKLMCTARANLREECRHPPFSASRLNKICCIISFAFSAVCNMLLLSHKPPSSSIPFKICLHYTSSVVHPLQKKNLDLSLQCTWLSIYLKKESRKIQWVARLSWKPHCFIRLHLKRRTVQLTCSKHSRNFSQTFQQGGTDQLTFLKLFKVNHIHIFSLKNWEMAILKISSVVFQKLYGLFEK